jgi:hypothetical protein
MPYPQTTELCFKTRQQIAREYGLSYSTFWRRLKYHGIELPPGLISLRWQPAIYEKMGYPPGVVAAKFSAPPRE